MATLADLARQYLNQALPDISGIFQPRGPSIPTPVPVEPEPEPGITSQLLQSTGRGGDDFSVYNPDPTKVRTDYRPYDYNKAMRNPNFPGVAPNPNLYYPESDLSGLLNVVPFVGPIKRGVEFVGGILDPYLPVNQRSIMENEARGMGILTDDIGRIVQGSGDYNTGANVMAGYNLSQITPETIEKRRNRILKTMSKPGYSGDLQKRLDALDEFEEMMFGTTGIKTRTDVIADEKTRAKGKIPLTDEIARNQARLDFQKLVNEGEEEQDLIDFLKVTDPNAIPTGIMGTTDFGYLGIPNRRDIIQDIGIQNVKDAIDKAKIKQGIQPQNIPATPGFDVSGGAGGTYDRRRDYSGKSDKTAGDRARTRDARKSDLGFSDIRLKENVELIGKSPSNINIYKFNYKDNPTTYQGVMAHEVPWANVKHDNGYMMVDYNKVDVEFKQWQK